jgi:hypothetical protein
MLLKDTIAHELRPQEDVQVNVSCNIQHPIALVNDYRVSLEGATCCAR